ncbi:MAG TPA: cell division ATP-binding protein FtsE [Armatimonadota bacterium]|nr:cell division ATP-binding protein FtsE [Armatimonadota bacterium]
MIEVVDVWLRHPEGNLALQDVRCRIEKGEFVFLVGSTGSGKSSLLRLLNRETRPTCGQVWVDGEDVAQLRRGKVPALRRKMGVVFQDFRLLPDRTIEENVAFALRVIGVHGKDLRARTFEALERVGIMSKGKMYPHQVSGGEQQRAAVARAIVNRPLLLIADEPTGNLDPETSRGIMDLLQQINDSGTTVLIATHDHAMVDAMCKRVIELSAGKVIRDEARGRYEAAPAPATREMPRESAVPRRGAPVLARD